MKLILFLEMNLIWEAEIYELYVVLYTCFE